MRRRGEKNWEQIERGKEYRKNSYLVSRKDWVKRVLWKLSVVVEVKY